MTGLPKGIELDEGIDPDEVERYGADSRDDVEIDLEALEAEAIAATDGEVDDDE